MVVFLLYKMYSIYNFLQLVAEAGAEAVSSSETGASEEGGLASEDETMDEDQEGHGSPEVQATLSENASCTCTCTCGKGPVVPVETKEAGTQYDPPKKSQRTGHAIATQVNSQDIDRRTKRIKNKSRYQYTITCGNLLT